MFRTTLFVTAALVAMAAPMTAQASTYGCISQTSVPATVCFGGGGWWYGSGDCNASANNYGQSNDAGASVGTGTTSTGANAYSGCNAWSMSPYSGTSSYAGAGFYHFDGSSWTYGGLQWYSYSYSDGTNSWSYCDMGVYDTTSYTPLGCPAGNPPSGMPLLP